MINQLVYVTSDDEYCERECAIYRYFSTLENAKAFVEVTGYGYVIAHQLDDTEFSARLYWQFDGESMLWSGPYNYITMKLIS